MASLYADENFPLPVVEELRGLGHDVLTALEAGQASRAIPDDEVLRLATSLGRAVLTLNRWHFAGLHLSNPVHAGIVGCTQDPDVARQAAAIDKALRSQPTMRGVLLRINRPA